LEINKTVIVASSWSSIFTLPTLMVHGQTQIKFTRLEYSVDWKHWTRFRDHWQGFVNKVMNLRVQ
jgi:hypothetical protein